MWCIYIFVCVCDVYLTSIFTDIHIYIYRNYINKSKYHTVSICKYRNDEMIFQIVYIYRYIYIHLHFFFKITYSSYHNYQIYIYINHANHIYISYIYMHGVLVSLRLLKLIHRLTCGKRCRPAELKKTNNSQ